MSSRNRGSRLRGVPVEVMGGVSYGRVVRPDAAWTMTSLRAGKVVPVWAAPVFREDRVSGDIVVDLTMEETIEPLANAVIARVTTWFAPATCFGTGVSEERYFSGIDEYNKAYLGKGLGTMAPKALSRTVAFNPTHEYAKALGLQAVNGAAINADYLAGYNAVANYRNRRKSAKMPWRSWQQHTLDNAFWPAAATDAIRYDYERDAMDGSVVVPIADDKFTVTGLGLPAKGVTGTNGASFETERDTTYPNYRDGGVRMKVDAAGEPRIYAQARGQAVEFSLADMQAAQKTAHWASIRAGIADSVSDDDAIDLIMQGISMPQEALRDPILLADQTGVFGFQTLAATDASGLGQSVTTGRLQIRQRLAMPRSNVHGVILVLVEVVPERIFDRVRDPFLHMTSGEEYPDALADTLDPEKVDFVKKSQVDVLHSEPDGHFGYAPMNWQHDRQIPRLGGKFYRNAVSGVDADRRKIWTPEVVDPALTVDFWKVGALDHSVFVDSLADPVAVIVRGGLRIEGNTQRGPGLRENRGDYAAVQAEVEQEKFGGVAPL